MTKEDRGTAEFTRTWPARILLERWLLFAGEPRIAASFSDRDFSYDARNTSPMSGDHRTISLCVTRQSTHVDEGSASRSNAVQHPHTYALDFNA